MMSTLHGSLKRLGVGAVDLYQLHYPPARRASSHAVGSCALGPEDDDVVGAQLRVRGVEGLRVVDASVLPFQVSGNTATPVMAVAWIAGDLIAGETARHHPASARTAA
jgi:choline dehydrogenase-like flavoprotein